MSKNTKNENVEKEADAQEETKYNTVSLKEIREALETKVNDKQKRSVVKEVLTNIFIAIIMLTYLIIMLIGKNNIDADVIEKDIKIITLSILAIGVFILEISYKKDSTRIAIHGTEVLVFGAANLCLIYVIKLYADKLMNVITYIGVGIAAYYMLKSIILTIRDIRKYRNDNNDIKEIVKKKEVKI